MIMCPFQCPNCDYRCMQKKKRRPAVTQVPAPEVIVEDSPSADVSYELSTDVVPVYEVKKTLTGKLKGILKE